jgi:hypothetical protein
MRRFGTATVLAGLLLLGGSWSLSATDTPKKAPGHARRKAVASRQTSTAGNADVKLDNLYVDAEIGQVFTVNLGRADQQAAAGESVASLGSVQIYQLGGSEIEPPTSAEVAGQADPADSAAPADDDETGPAAEEMQPADGDEAMEPAADDPAEEPAAAPEAAPQTSKASPQPDPGAAQQPAAPAAKDAPKTPPPASSSQAPPPPPPPIR